MAVNCPHCGASFEVEKEGKKGGLSLVLVSGDQGKTTDPDQETPKKPPRGKAREYSSAFEVAWKAYGRKEQKLEAFGVWLIRAKEVGGEPRLVVLVLDALKWQAPLWANDAWRFAPYFERYLKRRKWEDEPPIAAPVKPQPRFESFAEREERAREERREREREESERRIAATNAKAEEFRRWQRGG